MAHPGENVKKKKKILGDSSAYHSDNLLTPGRMYSIHLLLISSFFYSINAFWFSATCCSYHVLSNGQEDQEIMVLALEGWRGPQKWFIKLLFLVCLEALTYFYKETFFFLNLCFPYQCFWIDRKGNFLRIGKKKSIVLDTSINKSCIV